MDIQEADFVICGGGSAGCVLANRLSENGKYSVVLLEAGSKDNWIWFHVPVGYLFAIGNPRADWLFQTEPSDGLNGRVLNYPRGKVLGGSSAINAMIYMRGQAEDFDGWRDMGLAGWGWEDVLPFFKRQEDSWRGAGVYHGTGGEWRVERPRIRWEILDAFISAAASAGIAPSADFNTGSNEGCGYFDVNQKFGRRWSAARGFLRPALTRKKLEVITQALVDRVVVERGAVRAVIFRQGDQIRTIRARCEVILSAGAIGSPTILERSGIGAAQHLRSLGIEPVHDAPGVGANLQDHLQLRPIYKVSGVPTMNMLYRSYLRRGLMGLEYLLFRNGALTMAPSQLGAFTRSSPGYRSPNIQFHVQPLSLDKFGEALHVFPAITVSVCNLRPSSRGSVHIRSAAADQRPVIQPNYLSTQDDRTVAVQSMRRVREVMTQPALARYAPQEHRPGLQFQTDEELDKIAGEIGTTIFHPVGTARMGRADDPMAVVDSNLKAFGIDRLRVVDASVMPTITSGNTNSPTMMIAEKASQHILQEAAL